MANMFANKTVKAIPQDLWACRKPDPTASNLHVWAERLERTGKIIATLLIIAGVFCSVILGVSAADATRGDEDWLVFLGVFLGSGAAWTVIALLVYSLYHASALRIDALACIVQNTNISANVALYTAQENDPPIDAPEPEVTEPTKAPVTRSASPDRSSSVRFGWRCTCGAENNALSQCCKSCGKYK